MKKTDSPIHLSDLAKLARRRLAVPKHSSDHLRFRPFACSHCGVVPLALTIQHHTGSETYDFKGVIFALCSECGGQERVFSYTGRHRSPLREERPVCHCGSAYFLVAMSERFEREDGLPGFFDEGVIVGGCPQCGRRRTFLYTD